MVKSFLLPTLNVWSKEVKKHPILPSGHMGLYFYLKPFIGFNPLAKSKNNIKSFWKIRFSDRRKNHW